MSFFPTRRARKANNVRVFDLFLQKRHMIETACLVHVVVVVAAAVVVVVVVVVAGDSCALFINTCGAGKACFLVHSVH